MSKFKYIKRYMTPSGKWRYVYADKYTHNSIKQQQKAADAYNQNAKVHTGRANDAYREQMNSRKRALKDNNVLGVIDYMVAGQKAEALSSVAKYRKKIANAYTKSAQRDIEYNSVSKTAKRNARAAINKVKTSTSKLFMKKPKKITIKPGNSTPVKGTNVRDLPWSHPFKQAVYKKWRKPR